jgi:hypothetical protein
MKNQKSQKVIRAIKVLKIRIMEAKVIIIKRKKKVRNLNYL